MRDSLSSGNPVGRRVFLRAGGLGLGLGSIALRSLIAEESPSGGILVGPHHAPKAKRVIQLYMSGGPSHLETFDYKPALDQLDGKPMPESFTRGQPIAQLQGQALKVQGHMTRFRKQGNSGQLISDFLPYHARLADKITILRGMVTDQINHDPAHTLMNTGTALSGRPSMGSWITYGLGSESKDLPGFVVMTSFAGRNPQPISQRMWGSGFLPTRHQGVEFKAQGDPVHYLASPGGVTSGQQADLVNTISQLDQARGGKDISSRVAAYEMAFRMQSSVPALMDLSGETRETLDLYGAKPGDGSFASNCLTARRLAERGVRFIQLYHRDWDHHGDLVKYMNICCQATDRATWALISDLERRGMLEDTLVIWGGEFGRTPMFQGKGGPGRDHHIQGFSIWMAGGGIRPGTSYGGTDELGYKAVDGITRVRDLHATVLHLVGLDHERLTYKYQGLDARLTGVEPSRVVRDILA